jgi:D-3-phosphoglycerate dehydrogenase
MPLKVLVTPRSVSGGTHPQLDRLRAAGLELKFCRAGQLPGADELRELLPGCAGYLAGVEPIGADVLAAADSLKVIARNGAGVSNVDLAAAQARGIEVLPAPGANARGVAELTIGLMLACARAIPFSDRALKSGEWTRRNGIELEGRTLGLVGCGNVGRRVARMALGMDMRVIAFDQFVDETFRPGDGFRYATLDEVIESADVLSLHCPPAKDGRPLLGAANLGRLKRGAIVINTARADLIDSGAMLAALESGHIAGLGLDVFDPEPPGDVPLLKHERVVSTPHVGGFTTESVERAVAGAVDNLLDRLGGSR